MLSYGSTKLYKAQKPLTSQCKQSQVSIKQSAIKKALNINRPITIATEAWLEEVHRRPVAREVNLQCCRVRKEWKLSKIDFSRHIKEVCAVSEPTSLPNLSFFPKIKNLQRKAKKK